MKNFKEFLSEQVNIKKNQRSFGNGKIKVFTFTAITKDKTKIELEIHFEMIPNPNDTGKHLFSRKFKNQEMKLCSIDFTINDQLSKSTIKDVNKVIIILVQMFRDAFKDSGVLKNLIDTDVISIEGDGKWRHDTYEKFAKELARKLGAYDIIIEKPDSENIDINIILNKASLK